nr:hypothetical protein CFP56_35684 [Quercus suber]
MFHLIKDDKDAMFMTGLVRGHGHIHVYVQHPVHDPILINNGNGVTFDLVVKPELEPEPELKPEGYSSSDGEPSYEDGDDFYDSDDDFDGHQYFYEGHTTTIWARHMFRGDGLSDTVLNIMCESFNSRIVKFKGKPISMLEDIRLYLMNRPQQNRLSSLKVKYELCSALKLPPVQPPIKRRLPGKSKKKRARKPNEPRKGHSKGLGIAKRCKSCGKIGHNKRSCKYEVGGNSSLPTASGGGPNSRSSRLKQTTNRVHASGVSGASGGVAINEPNPPRIPPTKQAGSSATTTKQATSSAPPNSTTSNPSKNTHGNPKKRKKGSVTSETLNASRNASRLPPVQPPIKRRLPGKSKKKRARKPNEPRKGHSKGLGIAKRCKSCGKIGHNKRSCKYEVGGNSSLPTASGGGPNSRSSRLKQTTNRVHASGVSGASGGVAINEPNPPRIPPTKQAGSSATTTKQATSSAPPNSTTSNPSKNTHGNPKKRKKGSVTSETLNASRNASRTPLELVYQGWGNNTCMMLSSSGLPRMMSLIPSLQCGFDE